MKKTKEIMGLFLLSAALLAGCGTAADAPETGSTTPGTGTTGNVETEFQTPGPTEETQEELQEEAQENHEPVEGVHFEIDGTTFRIYGTGSMSSYEATMELQQSARKNQQQLAEVEHIQVEEGITDLGRFSFENWANLKSISLPNSLREISGSLFSRTNLTTEKDGFEICGTVLVKAPDRAEVVVPEGITHIAEGAFSNCTSIERLVLPEGLINISSEMFDYEREYPNLKVIEFPTSVEYIADWAFVEVKEAKKVFPAGCKVWQIDDTILSSEDVDWGVEPVNGLYIVNNMLVDTDAVSGEVVIPEGVTTICDYVFRENREITSVVLPESLKKIEDSAFSKCTGLVSVVVPAGVTSIEDSAFYDCIGLTSVQILGNIETVGENMFYGCGNLATVKIAGLATVSENMFRKCSSLTEISLPAGITEIGSSAFEDCAALPYIEIPEGVIYIRTSAFESCKALTEVKLPTTLKALDADVFNSCALTKIELPDGMERIQCDAFRHCVALVEVKWPNTVTVLEEYVFEDCLRLVSIEIPEGVEKIDRGVFQMCDKLEKVVIPETVTQIHAEAFKSSKLVTIYGKSGSYAEEYATANNIPFVAQ